MTEAPRLVTLGTVGGTPIQADVTTLGSDVPMKVALTADYVIARPPGFPSRPGLTGTDAADLDYPRTITNGTTIACWRARRRHWQRRCSGSAVSKMRNVPPLRYFQAAIDPVGELEADVTISTQARARDGDIWIASGVQLENYRQNLIVLFDHDPKAHVGTASNVRMVGNSVAARVTFAPGRRQPKGR